MKQEEFDEIACKAINAANEVIRQSGITDMMIHQLRFAKTKDVKSGQKDIVVEAVYDCPCWDCTQGPGPCICNGPACSKDQKD